MIYSISFQENAESELLEASEYYELRVKGLGAALISEVERAIRLIRKNPESAPKILKTVRRKVLWHFPYSVMYSVSGNSIRILAIANQKRRPFYWRRRK